MGMIAGGTGWLVLALLLILPGVVLLVRALRGRKINEHVVCRRCRFDLSGLGGLKATLGADGAVNAARCPECGSEVWRPGSVRVGQRRRARFGGLFALVGTVMLVLGLAGIGVFVSQRLAGTNWYARLPNWVLIEMADGWLGKANPEVMEEVVKRLPQLVSGPGVSGGLGTSAAVVAPGGLTNRQLGVLASRAAKGIESTASQPLIEAWLGVYREAMATPGLTTDEQSASVAAVLTGAKLRVRPMVRQGETMFAEFDPAAQLTGSDLMGVVWSPQRLAVKFKLADGSWSDSSKAVFQHRVLMARFSSGLAPGPADAIEHAPGEYEVRVEGVYVPTITTGSRLPLGGGWDVQEAILAKLPTRTVEWTGTVKVLPRELPAMEMDVSAEAVREATSGARVAMLRWKGGAYDAHITSMYGKDGVTPSLWDLRLLIDCPDTLYPGGSFLRIVVQGKDEHGRAVGEPWGAFTYRWASDGTMASGMASPNWRGGGKATSDKYRLDAPLVDILIEPKLEQFEKSMFTRVIGARLRFTNVRVQDVEGSPVNVDVALRQLSGGQYRADAAGLKPEVLAMTGEELVRAAEEDRAARAAKSQPAKQP